MLSQYGLLTQPLAVVVAIVASSTSTDKGPRVEPHVGLMSLHPGTC